MQNIDLSFAQDPNTLSLALMAGVLPAILWIFFWLREGKERPRSAGALFMTFLLGVFMVILALPVEKTVALFSGDANTLTVLWAASEEFLKFGAFLIILFATSWIELPIDYPVYMMIVALGFAGFENSLYFLQPLQSGTTNILILAGSMRFLGTTLMHAAVSCLPGIMLGFAFFKNKKTKIIMASFGLLLAVLGHSLFNIFITEQPDLTFFIIISLVWLLTILIMILMEKLRERGSTEYLRNRRLGIVSEMEKVFRELLVSAGMNENDPDPILAGLTKKNFAPDSKEHNDLEDLLSSVRIHYSSYLEDQGAKEDQAEKSSQNLISDTISAKALSGIFTVLKR